MVLVLGVASGASIPGALSKPEHHWDLSGVLSRAAPGIHARHSRLSCTLLWKLQASFWACMVGDLSLLGMRSNAAAVLWACAELEQP